MATYALFCGRVTGRWVDANLSSKCRVGGKFSVRRRPLKYLNWIDWVRESVVSTSNDNPGVCRIAQDTFTR